MPLDTCPTCEAKLPTGPGDEVLKARIDHMKTHGADFSYLLDKKKTENNTLQP